MSDDDTTSPVIKSSDFHILPKEVQNHLNTSVNSVGTDLDSPCPEKSALPKILQNKVEEQDTPIFRKAISKFTSTISKKLEAVSKSKFSSKSSASSEASSRNQPVVSTPQRRDSLTNLNLHNQILTPSYSQFDVDTSPSSKNSNENSLKNTPNNFWSIDQLAIIDPKDINESNGYLKTFQTVLSPNKEKIHINSIKNFFQNNHHIFQSPSPEKKSSRDALDSESKQNQHFYLAVLTPNAENNSKSSSHHSHPLSSSKKRSRTDNDDLISNDDTIHSSTLEQNREYPKVDPIEFFNLLKSRYQNQALPEYFETAWYDSILKTESNFNHKPPPSHSSPQFTPKFYNDRNKSVDSMDTSISRRRRLFQNENEDGFSDVNCSLGSVTSGTNLADLSKPCLADAYKWQATPSGSPRNEISNEKSTKAVSPKFLENLESDPFSSMSPVQSDCDSDQENIEPSDGKNLPRSSGCDNKLMESLEFEISPILNSKKTASSVLQDSNTKIDLMPVTPASEMMNMMKLETPRDDSMNVTANQTNGNTSQEQWFDARSQNSTSNSFLNNFSTSHNNMTSGYESNLNLNSKSISGFPNRTNSLCNLKISMKADEFESDPHEINPSRKES